MAAYGALVSVMQIMDQLYHHPRPPISIHKQQTQSLTANLTFLQEFLESYNPHRSYTSDADPLESRIAEAAYAAEDAIESYIVEQIHAQYNNGGKMISSVEFYQGLQNVIEEMDLIKMEIKEKMKEKKETRVQILKKSAVDAGSSRSSSNAQKVAMVGFEDVLNEMLDKITGGGRERKIIPIVGMGGLGKTTLARNIYANPLIKEKFHICAWSTISQVHNAQKILTEILDQLGLDSGGDLSEGDLGVKLYRHLIGRRYLIVMDDMWSIEAWDVVRRYFPENDKGSRVVVTTRLSNLASKFDYSDGLNMKFLDEVSSRNLFSKTVFGEEICPRELEGIGKRILKGCKGLPLSIVVAGGLLSKCDPTLENWKLIEENLSSVVNLEDEGSCLRILYTSYNFLPVHLKPCFLYFGMFPEDADIAVLVLVQLLIAEGIIKPIDGKSLEEAAKEYLKELEDRNLLLVEGRDLCGEVEIYKIHDLLRDLSLREAVKVKFLSVLGEQSIHKVEQGISSLRRIKGKLTREHRSDPLILQSLTSASLVRTSFLDSGTNLSSNYRLLRILAVADEIASAQDFKRIFVPLVNLRLLINVEVTRHPLLTSPDYPLYFLWNLQSLALGKASDDYRLELRRLPLLRNVMLFDGSLCGLDCLPDYDPRSATWHYVGRNKTLGESISLHETRDFEQLNNHMDMESCNASQEISCHEEEDLDIPDILEDIIELLLSGLRDTDTVVRWSAAKGVGRVASRLTYSIADEVLSSVLELFSPSEGDGSCHGECLALGELARRGLLLPISFPKVVPVITKALHYDIRRGPHSVGSHVRDAVAYDCWAFGRAYYHMDMKNVLEQVAPHLLTVACYDREVNWRRAAAAAFQENVGRQGNLSGCGFPWECTQ